MPVVAADPAVVLIEHSVAALGLVAVADHRGRIAAPHIRRAVDPQPGVVVGQQLHVHIRVVPLPPAQLWQSPHVAGVDAAVLRQPGGDRAIQSRVGRGEETRQRAGEPVAVGMERRDRHRTGAPLRGADDAVAAGSQALVGRHPVGQLVGEEGLPLPAAVLFPVGVEAPCATGGRGHRDALTGEGVHRVARRHPVADIRRGVERVEKNDHVRATALEGDGDVAAHRGRRHHQILDVGLGDRCRCGPQPHGQRHGQDPSKQPTHETPPHVASALSPPQGSEPHSRGREEHKGRRAAAPEMADGGDPERIAAAAAVVGAD